jgi:SAM-dependent methyltransferase
VEQKEMERKICSTKDYLVTGEEFDIIWNSENQIGRTVPFPEKSTASKYYKSSEYLSHKDSSVKAINRLYFFSRFIMFGYKMNILQKYIKKEENILDFGCGSGEFLKRMSVRYKAYGVEPFFKPKTDLLGAQNRIKRSWSSTFPKKFKVICLWHVLEHLYEVDKQLLKFYSHLEDDGALVFALPNMKSFDAVKYSSFWAGYDAPRHLWHFTELGIVKKLKKFNFKLVEVKPLFLDSLYVSYLSEKHKKNLFPLIKGVFWGIISNIIALRTGEYSSKIYIFKKT